MNWLNIPPTLVSPYVAAASVYTGNIHCHTTNSDGDSSPQVVAEAYKAAGYDFLGISDHNFLTTPPTVSGLLTIPGIEDTWLSPDSFFGYSHNMHLIRINAVTPPPAGTVQNHASWHPVDAMNAGNADDSIVSLAHPTMVGFIPTAEELASLTGLNAVEVWNCNTNAETTLDTFLTAGRHMNALAVDDAHYQTVSNPEYKWAFTGWVRVFANECTKDAIMAALKAGNYYSCGRRYQDTGDPSPELTITVSGATITCAVASPSTISFIGAGGTVFKTSAAHATTSSYTASRTDKYVRIKVVQDPVTAGTASGYMAWSNPIYVIP